MSSSNFMRVEQVQIRVVQNELELNLRAKKINSLELKSNMRHGLKKSNRIWARSEGIRLVFNFKNKSEGIRLVFNFKNKSV